VKFRRFGRWPSFSWQWLATTFRPWREAASGIMEKYAPCCCCQRKIQIQIPAARLVLVKAGRSSNGVAAFSQMNVVDKQSR